MRRQNQVAQDKVLRVQAALTIRDHRLLSLLHDHGLLTTDQINHALFGSLDFCQRRLLKLVRHEVIARFRPQRPDGGSYPYHYVLDQLGADVVAAQRLDPPPRRDQARNRRRHLTSRANLPHLLGINQFFVELLGYQRLNPGSRLERWWPAARLQRLEALYRKGDNPQMMLMVPQVRPDGHGVWAENGVSVSFLLEHDTGTESLRILTEKAHHYHRLTHFTSRRWPVLFWLPTAAREMSLHQRLADFSFEVPIATAAQDHANLMGLSPAEELWWLHGHPGDRLRLAQLPCTGEPDLS